MTNKKIWHNSENIEVDGRTGTWHVVDSGIAGFRTVFLLEHEEWGDETDYIIVDEDGDILSQGGLTIRQYDTEVRNGLHDIIGMTVEEMVERFY